MSTARLRAEIDAGNTGDWSAGIDPAAAPLGTDEEAAGTPIPPALAEQVRQDELRMHRETVSRQNGTPAAADVTSTDTNVETTSLAFVWAVTCGLGLAVIVLVYLILGPL